MASNYRLEEVAFPCDGDKLRGWCETEKELETVDVYLQWTTLQMLPAARQGGSFNRANAYCLTPPVIPFYDGMRAIKIVDQIICRHLGTGEIKERECIVCGKVHVTSEDCGREPPDNSGKDQTHYRDDGYKLLGAAAMGFEMEDY